MTIPEEIEQLKIKLGETADERKQAEVLLEILKEYSAVNSTDAQPFIDRLLQLAEKLNEALYKAWGLNYLANLKRQKSEFDAALDISWQALPLLEQINDKRGIAYCYGNIGKVYERQGNFPQALKNYFVSLKGKEEIDDQRGIAQCYLNIGSVYERQGNYPEALKNHFAGLKLSEAAGNKPDIANFYSDIGIVYRFLGNYPEALKNNFAALKLREEMGDKRGIATSYNNIGIVYHFQSDYPEALKNHLAALKLREEIGDKSGIADSFGNIGNVYYAQGNYPETLKKYFAALKLIEEMGTKEVIAVCYTNIGSVYNKQGNYPEALKYLLIAVKMSEEIGYGDSAKVASLALTNVYKATSDFENALKYHEKYHRVESEMLGEQAQKQITNLSFMHNLEQKEKDLEIEQLRNVELKKERDRSEALLLNILPAEVAEELKAKGSADAKQFDEVTVMFTDFKNFTQISEKLSPSELVAEIHTCFKAFDGIMTKHNIEKIKTIGDSYMCAGGLPLANKTNAADVVSAALEIQQFMQGHLRQRKNEGKEPFEIRIGVNTGPVVAGIVGVKKFAYDIWGDTVNIASRMESSGEAGKVNISGSTYELVKDKFACTYRGKIHAKNKGEIDMYFVE